MRAARLCSAAETFGVGDELEVEDGVVMMRQ
jgi:hypothetical protein